MEEIHLQQYANLFSGDCGVKMEWSQPVIGQTVCSNNVDINATKMTSLQTAENFYQNSSSCGRYKSDKLCTNRLGGQYSSGRPLPMPIREKIVELSKMGLKPCQISKQLQVSHGCVSKLLTRWRKTGSVQPERIGGSTPKKVLPYVATAIKVYKRWRPHLQTWQIRQRLIADGVCTTQNVPSISSINKTLRSLMAAKPENLKTKEAENFRNVVSSTTAPFTIEKSSPPPYHQSSQNVINQLQQYPFYRNVLESNNANIGQGFPIAVQTYVHHHHHQQQPPTPGVNHHGNQLPPFPSNNGGFGSNAQVNYQHQQQQPCFGNNFSMQYAEREKFAYANELMDAEGINQIYLMQS